MERIDWHLTGIVAAGVLVGCFLLVLAWKAVRFLFKVVAALVFLILLGLGVWYWIRQAS